MDKWDVKQIFDAVSKGINTFLMSQNELPTEQELRALAEDLKQIYVNIIKELKKEITEEEKKDNPWDNPEF